MVKPEIDDDKLKALANYLNTIKNDRNIGFNQLALKAGIGSAVLNNILSGTIKKVNPFFLQGLAKAFRIDYKILYRIVGYLDSNENDKLIGLDLEQEIIVYSKVYASENGSLQYGEILEQLTIPSLCTGAEIIGIRIDGNEMDYTIPDKSTVIVKKDVIIADNEIGIFILNNIVFIKRYRDKDGVKMLTSDNRDYDHIIVKDTDDFIVKGKLIKVMYNL